MAEAPRKRACAVLLSVALACVGAPGWAGGVRARPAGQLIRTGARGHARGTGLTPPRHSAFGPALKPSAPRPARMSAAPAARLIPGVLAATPRLRPEALASAPSLDPISSVDTPAPPEQSSSEQLDGLFELRLRPGRTIKVLALRGEEDKERGMMFRPGVPAQGMIEDLGSDARFHLWTKNMLVPVDVVTMNRRGVIKKVLPNLAPSPPGTPWRQVGLHAGKGRFVLTLPAGEARRSRLVPGRRIGGVKAATESWPEPEELARLIREDGDKGLETALSHFEAYPENYVNFDTVVGLVKRERAAKRRLYEAVLKGKHDLGRWRYLYEDILGWHDPLLWFRFKDDSAAILVFEPLLYT